MGEFLPLAMLATQTATQIGVGAAEEAAACKNASQQLNESIDHFKSTANELSTFEKNLKTNSDQVRLFLKSIRDETKKVQQSYINNRNNANKKISDLQYVFVIAFISLVGILLLKYIKADKINVNNVI